MEDEIIEQRLAPNDSPIEEELFKEAMGMLIWEKREKAHFTREEFARKINKSPNTLYFIEKGGIKERKGRKVHIRHQVSLVNLVEIARGLEIDPGDLITEAIERYEALHTKQP